VAADLVVGRRTATISLLHAASDEVLARLQGVFHGRRRGRTATGRRAHGGARRPVGNHRGRGRRGVLVVLGSVIAALARARFVRYR
jgi:hypothetical protein